MKNTIKKIGGILSLCALASLAQAVVVFQDNFNYATGALTNSTWVAGAGGTLNGNIAVNGTGGITIGYGTTTSDQPRAYFTNGFVSAASAPNFPHTLYLFPSNSPAAALYTSFNLTMNGNASSGTYVAFLTDSNFTYYARIYTTNAPGGSANGYQLAVQNCGSTYLTNKLSGVNLVNPVILTPGQSYQIVVRYVNALGLVTLWVNPTGETFTGIANSTDTSSQTAVAVTNFTAGSIGVNTNCIAGIGFRNASGIGQLIISNLVVGTSFTDAVPGSVASIAPVVSLQPANVLNAITNNTVSFTTAAFGDPGLGYQWYSVIGGVTNAVTGGTSQTLTLTGVTTSQSGYYFAAATNAVGTNYSQEAQLVVYSVLTTPAITTQPVATTIGQGDTLNLTVGASGVPTPTYQWYWITNSGATFKTNLLTGATGATYSYPEATTNQDGSYYVIANNAAGYATSSVVAVTVTAPVTNSISHLRTLVNGSYLPTNTTTIYTIQGIVTTWTNTTTSANSEFYMQDSTAGICVFWSGAAASTNLPPAGAKVSVTGPMANFNGLLELEPVFGNALNGVTILSTNNPLPTPQPLPFDPNVTGNQALMEQMESTYFVASNVTLQASPTVTSGATEQLTNNFYHVKLNTLESIGYTNAASQSFTIYWNAYTGIPGKAKPAGPVTVYGVLGNYNGTYEFTPTRYADIVSYIQITNVVTGARAGDAPTNNYTENVLRPGETLTTYYNLSDPEGGNITNLTPASTTLNGTVIWTNFTTGSKATGVFRYTAVTADAGTQYPVQLTAGSDSGNSFTPAATLYVPTAQEQGIAITEILANPTTNPAAAFYNPLQRGTPDTTGTNDEYVEIANQSASDLEAGYTLYNGTTKVFDSDAVSGDPTVYSSNSVVIYGGGSSGPGIGGAQASTVGSGLSLSAGGNTLVLRDQNGYIIDRVVYGASSVSANGSISRFPTWNSAFVPQTYISTNLVTPGLQYDGGSWSNPTKVPTGIAGVTIIRTNGQSLLHFPANTTQANTLWNAGTAAGPYNVINGQPFPSGTGAFTNATTAPYQFYFITTQ